MKRKMISALLLSAMVLSITACGNTKTDSTTNVETKVETSSTVETTTNNETIETTETTESTESTETAEIVIDDATGWNDQYNCAIRGTIATRENIEGIHTTGFDPDVVSEDSPMFYNNEPTVYALYDSYRLGYWDDEIYDFVYDYEEYGDIVCSWVSDLSYSCHEITKGHSGAAADVLIGIPKEITPYYDGPEYTGENTVEVLDTDDLFTYYRVTFMEDADLDKINPYDDYMYYAVCNNGIKPFYVRCGLSKLGYNLSEEETYNGFKTVVSSMEFKIGE